MFSKQQRFAIYEAIKSQGNFLGSYSKDQGIMSFLSSIWPLRGMDSEDSRYSNAYDDAFQHLVNNNDWDDDQTYLTRFKLLDGHEDYFIKFVELVVHPNTRHTREQIQTYVQAVNSALEGNSIILVVSDYFNELPVYRFGERSKVRAQSDIIPRNNISFYKEDVVNKRFPCFVLGWDKWDDYGHKTRFVLTYYNSDSDFRYIGPVKIMKLDTPTTWDVISENFKDLDTDFCSLGQSGEYYTTLKNLLPDLYQSVLLALRDCAFYTVIHEKFENNSIFKTSLIRDNSVEKLRRTIRAELLGNYNLGYRFNYIFRPPYGGDDGGFVNLYFNFEPDPKFPQRIIAMIGKNGVGKTRILSSMIEELRKRKSNAIVPNDLIFGKYFTVSYSAFDTFHPPTPDTSFNYVYCGLKKDANTIKPREEQLTEFYSASDQIVSRGLQYQWFQILSAFLSTEHLRFMFPRYENELDFGMVTFDVSGFRQIESHFSSGESILLFVTTKIVSEIREQSLILYDEPETHLHPNAISDLMNAFDTLLNRFNSFCIIATHSPLIVRELPPHNVIVLRRLGDGLEANTLAIDSFGQNLTVITEQIFGNREVNKLHLERIKTLVQERRTFDEIIGILQEKNVPVNLNTRLFLSTLMEDRNEEPRSL